jgi:hypothetical protein
MASEAQKTSAICGTALGLSIAILSACTSSKSPATSNVPVYIDITTDAPLTGTKVGAQTTLANNFQQLNGFMWFFNTSENIKFSDVTSQLATWQSQGVNVLAFDAPYNGDPNVGLGSDPLDFYNVPPQSGTIQDWNALVAAAHARGMKVISYFASTYIDVNSTFFVTAQQQYAAGNTTAREVSAFHWTTNPNDPLPTPSAGTSAWVYSAIAGAYYWSLGGEAGFDYNLPGALAEVQRIEEFWLDTGLDGFVWDAGNVNPTYQYYMAEYPKIYTSNDKLLSFETTQGAQASSYAGFGLTAWNNDQDDETANDYSLVVTGGQTIAQLETSLKNADFARTQGGLTQEESLLSGSYANETLMRVQEAALLAGAGILYGVSGSAEFSAWSPAIQANWGKVMSAVNSNPALLPSASRAQIPASATANAYAMTRTSADGSQTALLAYNFSGAASVVTLNLAGTTISTSQTPVDLYSGGTAPPITGTSYTLNLPAYGFSILQVSSVVQSR